VQGKQNKCHYELIKKFRANTSFSQIQTAFSFRPISLLKRKWGVGVGVSRVSGMHVELTGDPVPSLLDRVSRGWCILCGVTCGLTLLLSLAASKNCTLFICLSLNTCIILREIYFSQDISYVSHTLHVNTLFIVYN
jgi:hypothetical protein